MALQIANQVLSFRCEFISRLFELFILRLRHIVSLNNSLELPLQALLVLCHLSQLLAIFGCLIVEFIHLFAQLIFLY